MDWLAVEIGHTYRVWAAEWGWPHRVGFSSWISPHHLLDVLLLGLLRLCSYISCKVCWFCNSWVELPCSLEPATAFDLLELPSRSNKAIYRCLLQMLDMEASRRDYTVNWGWLSPVLGLKTSASQGLELLPPAHMIPHLEELLGGMQVGWGGDPGIY